MVDPLNGWGCGQQLLTNTETWFSSCPLRPAVTGTNERKLVLSFVRVGRDTEATMVLALNGRRIQIPRPATETQAADNADLNE